MTTLCKFGTLRLCIVRCFSCILKETLFKGFPLNNLSFKLKIDPTFVKTVFKTRRISGNVRSWVFAKTVIEVIEQSALEEEEVSGVRRTL